MLFPLTNVNGFFQQMSSLWALPPANLCIINFLKPNMMETAVENTTTTKWAIDTLHSEVQFKVKHLVISTVTGSFKQFDGGMTTDGVDALENAKVQFEIEASSIDTNQQMRDDHLRSADFFETEKFPKISFQSTAFKKLTGDKYVMTGALTIKDVTKELELGVEFGGEGKDAYGVLKRGFEVAGVINRKDFGLTYNAVTEAGGLTIGEEIKLLANIQVSQQN